MPERLRRVLPALIGLVLFFVALVVLRHELRAVSWRELSADVLATPRGRLAAALALTVANYLALTGYDFLALAYVGRSLPWDRVVLTSFLAYALANTVGFSMLSGASVRYRFYTRWGLTPPELSRVVFSYAVTFWLGLLLLGGLSLATGCVPATASFPPEVIVPIGVALVAVSAAYVPLTVLRRTPLHVGSFELPIPSPKIATLQLVVSVIDWVLAAAVLYVLLPASELRFLGLLGAFVGAQLLGVSSNVPGGLGIFEGSMVLLLAPFLAADKVLPALVVYRAVYYLLPLAVALTVLVADELHQRRAQAARVSSMLGRMTELLTPRIVALFTFLSGVILLFSGATPAAAGRLTILQRILPLGVIEASHFSASVVGATLLLLSQGLARRLDAAYVLTLIAIVFGIVASILKGFDYEEAVALGLVLIVLWRARPAFDRRAAFWDTRFSLDWIVAVVCAMSATIWLGWFAFKHVQYSTELWWQFELHGEASRFLRASVGSAVVLLLFAFGRLIGHAPHEIAEPTDGDLDAAGSIIGSQTATLPYLVYLRDKGLLFDEGRTAFVMYGVQGRTWVALGDPVGPPDRTTDLIRTFLERCDDFGGVPVFYQTQKDQLHRYADFGLTFLKLGEEARVDLTSFTLQGGHAKKFRQALRRLDDAGATFRIVDCGEAAAMLDELREVSDDWLGSKAGGEKGFSLGFFSPDYLKRFPVAVIEQGGRVVAFTNIWPGPGRVELSVDLMRYRREAPDEAMEGLLLQLMQWGQREGYRWFSLGMAPLSGFERSPVAPLWARLGSFLYEHGEAFYRFQGLRAYKEKFHPVWEPRYLVYPGGLRLPHVLTDVAALVAGGYRKILLK